MDLPDKQVVNVNKHTRELAVRDDRSSTPSSNASSSNKKHKKKQTKPRYDSDEEGEAFEVERIIGSRVINGYTQYHVKWANFDE